MYRVDTLEELREVINLHRSDLEQKYRISRIALFGSAARDALSDSSDIDILVEFDGSIGFFALAHLQDELCSLLGRNIDLTTTGALHPLLRNSILQDLVYV
jgi:predicted nucleotidyltransferase